MSQDKPKRRKSRMTPSSRSAASQRSWRTRREMAAARAKRYRVTEVGVDGVERTYETDDLTRGADGFIYSAPIVDVQCTKPISLAALKDALLNADS